MNIVPTQIRGFNLQFTEAELAGLIDDLPRESKYRGPLIAARNGAFDDEAAGAEEPKRKTGGPSKLGRLPKGERKPFAQTQCPVCGRKLSEARLGLHLRTKHPGQPQSFAPAARS